MGNLWGSWFVTGLLHISTWIATCHAFHTFPLIGNRINGWMGHTVDTFAVLGTLFGIATTLGLSVTQINTGMNYLLPTIPVSIPVQIATILIITLLATLSVVAGMDKGIKRLSVLNIGLAIALMIFVFVVGPTLFILQTFVENTGSYLSNLVERLLTYRLTLPMTGLVTGHYLSLDGQFHGHLLSAYSLPKLVEVERSDSSSLVSCSSQPFLPSYGFLYLEIQHSI